MPDVIQIGAAGGAVNLLPLESVGTTYADGISRDVMFWQFYNPAHDPFEELGFENLDTNNWRHTYSIAGKR